MSPEEVAARRHVLVGALTKCLDSSRVKEIVAIDSVRSILYSAASELWREGEFRLEMVWKVLCQQPGLSPQEVAPPLLAFKSFEADLEVNVRLPQALSALPPAEQAKLREQVTLTRDEFTAELKQLAAAAAAEVTQPPQPAKGVEMAQAAQAAAEATQPPRSMKRQVTRAQKIAAISAAVVAMLAGGVSLLITLRDTAKVNEMGDVGPILQLAEGKRVEHSLSARIVDPRWETMPRDEQRRVAAQLFDREREKGIQVLTLIDASGRVRVSANNAVGPVIITVH